METCKLICFLSHVNHCLVESRHSLLRSGEYNVTYDIVFAVVLDFMASIVTMNLFQYAFKHNCTFSENGEQFL